MVPLGPNPAEIDQPFAHPHTERRRRVRHKLHLPAYVGLNSAQHQTPDLCEIIDLSEDGMAIQTASSIEVGGDESLVLDLPETNTSVQTAGTMIWSDGTGRAGVHFLGLPPESLHALREWLFADALAGCAQHAVEAGESNLAEPGYESECDYTSVLTGLAAVSREVESLGSDLDAALHLIARRAQAFTRSSAAAIGLTDSVDMICRAAAGPTAPAPGARLRIGSGFSGECVRSAILLRCDDSETDSRVDRESCRALGIRSMMAAPIRSRGSVIGLIEIFSTQPGFFQPEHEVALQHLTEIASVAVRRAERPDPLSPGSAASVDDEFPIETPADLPILQLSRSRNPLLMGVAIAALLGLLWVMQPWVTQHWPANGDGGTGAPASASQPIAPPKSPDSQAEALQRLATSGDPAAQFDVGVRYWTGDHVPQDYGQAVHWFSLAAEQGNVASQAMLGSCYWACRGVPGDPMRAYFWSVLAENGGDEASKSRVALLATRLTPSQIAGAHKEVNDWMTRHPRVAKDSAPTQ